MIDINSNQLARQLATCEDISVASAIRCVHAMGNIIAANLKEGRSVKLYGVGTFLPKMRKCRLWHNVSTGQKQIIPEKAVVKFKPSSKLVSKKTIIPAPSTPAYKAV